MKKYNLTQAEPDEKGTGGAWDFAGEIARNFVHRLRKDQANEEKLEQYYEALTEMIYNAIKYQLKTEEE